MRRSLVLLAGLVTACAAPVSQGFDDRPRELLRGDFHLLIGQRDLDDEAAWSDLSDQLAGGVIWTDQRPGSLVGLEVGLLGSVEDTTVRTPDGPDPTADLDAWMVEGCVGAIASAPLGRVRPYVGAGVSLVHVEFDTTLGATSEVLHADDDLFGGYVHAGLLFEWTEDSHVGVDWRMLRAGEETFADLSYEVDYQQVSLVFGASF